jgi:hypothetical protein
MKGFWHELKHDLSRPGFYIAVALAVFVVAVVNGIARKYIPGIKTVEDTVTNAVTPSA